MLKNTWVNYRLIKINHLVYTTLKIQSTFLKSVSKKKKKKKIREVLVSPAISGTAIEFHYQPSSPPAPLTKRPVTTRRAASLQLLK